jgi:hypothetical protein
MLKKKSFLARLPSHAAIEKRDYGQEDPNQHSHSAKVGPF